MRYRLRTLLIVVTAIAVMTALLAGEYRRQQALMRKILEEDSVLVTP